MWELRVGSNEATHGIFHTLPVSQSPLANVFHLENCLDICIQSSPTHRLLGLYQPSWLKIKETHIDPGVLMRFALNRLAWDKLKKPPFVPDTRRLILQVRFGRRKTICCQAPETRQCKANSKKMKMPWTGSADRTGQSCPQQSPPCVLCFITSNTCLADVDGVEGRDWCLLCVPHMFWVDGYLFLPSLFLRVQQWADFSCIYRHCLQSHFLCVCVYAYSACGGVTRRPRGQSRRQRGRSTCTTQGARRRCSPRWRGERASLFARGGCPASTPPAPWPTTASTARVSPPSPTPMKSQVCIFVSVGENTCVYLHW